jgi:hypothetical protein
VHRVSIQHESRAKRSGDMALLLDHVVVERGALGILWCAAVLGKIKGAFFKKVSPQPPCCFTLASFLLFLAQGKR